uniref:Ranatuerin-2OK n=2 Tax=Ranidae TaxID=8397 RepID=RN2_NIDOK|nr:RecName: Full=Ranatuerin-2OK [Nidirana okinavana]
SFLNFFKGAAKNLLAAGLDKLKCKISGTQC